MSKRIAIVGAGFISSYHIKAVQKISQTEIVAICDVNKSAAEALAAQFGLSVEIYTSLEQMLETQIIDIVHVLTQPNSHFEIASYAIKQGCNVVLEKPATSLAAEAEELIKLSEQYDVNVTVNHNFTQTKSFQTIKSIIQKKKLGKIKDIQITWAKHLPQYQFGPWDAWMLQHPSHMLLETGSHVFAELYTIVEKVKINSVIKLQEIILPSGVKFVTRWSIRGQSGDTNIQINLFFDSGEPAHMFHIVGSNGVLQADIENDLLLSKLPTGRLYDFEVLIRNSRASLKMFKQTINNYKNYALSKILSKYEGNAYDFCMIQGVRNCYKQLGMANNDYPELTLNHAIKVTKLAEQLIKKSKLDNEDSYNAPDITEINRQCPNPEVLIIGGSGFIGQRIVSQLQTIKNIRILIRNASAIYNFESTMNCHFVLGDFRDEKIIDNAMKGIKYVIHLAVSHHSNIDDYRFNNLKPTLYLANTALKYNVRRFIYAGTIDSLALYKDGLLTEDDGLDNDLCSRNNYAHVKGQTEIELSKLYETKNLPLAILRPAIVIDDIESLKHVGIANWVGENICYYWGDGKNKLPLVHVDDVANAFVQSLDNDAVNGQTFNLSSEPSLTARDCVELLSKHNQVNINSKSSILFKYYLIDFFKWIVKLLTKHPDKNRRPSYRDWKAKGQYAVINSDNTKELMSAVKFRLIDYDFIKQVGK